MIFQAGGGLPEQAPTYTIRQVLDNDAFANALQGKLLHVIAPRQVGKTSFLHYLRRRLQDRGWRCVTVDLSPFSSFSMEAWYAELGKQLTQALTPGISLTLTNHFTLAGYLTNEIFHARHGQPYVAVFFDGVESVVKGRDEQDQPFSDDFFSTIRSLYDNEKKSNDGTLTMGLVSAVSDVYLIKNRSISPFNIGYRLHFDDFTQQEAKALTSRLNTLPVNIDDAIHEEIYAWTSGHPYLTQCICAEIEKLIDGSQISTVTNDEIKRIVEALFLYPPQPTMENTNLRHVKKMLKQLPSPASSFWDHIRQGETVLRKNVDMDIFSDIYMTGVVGSEDERLIIRNRIYRAAFLDQNLSTSQHVTPDSISGHLLVKKDTEQQIGTKIFAVLDSDKEQRSNGLEDNKSKEISSDHPLRSPWRSGTFYLFAFGSICLIVCLVMICLVAIHIPWYYVVSVLILCVVIFVMIIISQFRQDDRLNENGFTNILKLALNMLLKLIQPNEDIPKGKK